MKVFVFQRSADRTIKSRDGGLTINIPAPKEQLVQTSGTRDSLYRLSMSDEEYEARIRRSAEASAARKGASEIVEIDTTELPIEHYDLRDAWMLSGKSVVVDIKKAKEVTRARLRKEREPELTKLGHQLNRALAAKDAARVLQIDAETQRLLDITTRPEIDAATTPEELKAISLAATRTR